MTQVEAIVQRYYGDRPVLQRIDEALRAAGVDPERPSHRDLWTFDQLHSRGIVATREHAERARIQAGMYVLDLGCGLGGSSRYLAAECGCRVAAIDTVGSGGDPVFPLAWADDEASSFLVSPAKMRAELEAGGLSAIEQVDLTATRLGETGRQPVIERDDFPLRLQNLQSCLADGRLIAQFILAEKRR